MVCDSLEYLKYGKIVNQTHQIYIGLSCRDVIYLPLVNPHSHRSLSHPRCQATRRLFVSLYIFRECGVASSAPHFFHDNSGGQLFHICCCESSPRNTAIIKRRLNHWMSNSHSEHISFISSTTNDWFRTGYEQILSFPWSFLVFKISYKVYSRRNHTGSNFLLCFKVRTLNILQVVRIFVGLSILYI